MKSSRVKTIGFVLLVVLVASTALVAQDVPLRNWTVPAYNSGLGRVSRGSQAPAAAAASPSGALSPMTDIGDIATAFVPMQPCRVVDTRGGGPFTGAYGPPSLVANATRNFDINSAPHCPGIPAAATGYSLNFTVLTPNAAGDLRAWPQDNAPSVTTSVVNFVAGDILANATILAAGTGGGITVQMAGASGGLLIDINGYFTGTLNDQEFFEVIGTWDPTFFGIIPGGVAFFRNNTTLTGYSVNSQIASAANGTASVNGNASAGTGRVYGILGSSSSTSDFAAGVYGTGNTALPFGACADCNAAGVNGRSRNGAGVLGVSATPVIEEGAVTGIFTDTAGVEYTTSRGALGYSSTTGVRASNNISKGGTVSFTEPHATDASKKVIYVALEGNEAGTYFRGRGRFQNGMATINVPEDFRMVTQPEGLTIQVTPIGEMASVAVVSIGLDRIVVRGSRNVEFFYTVNGVRHGYGDFSPIAENDKDFLPVSAESRMPEGLRPEIRERLIANGTYNRDGTVNMETAQRLGWDRVWAERARPAPSPE